jgi:hypothetical protein
MQEPVFEEKIEEPVFTQELQLRKTVVIFGKMDFGERYRLFLTNKLL